MCSERGTADQRAGGAGVHAGALILELTLLLLSGNHIERVQSLEVTDKRKEKGSSVRIGKAAAVSPTLR